MVRTPLLLLAGWTTDPAPASRVPLWHRQQLECTVSSLHCPWTQPFAQDSHSHDPATLTGLTWSRRQPSWRLCKAAAAQPLQVRQQQQHTISNCIHEYCPSCAQHNRHKTRHVSTRNGTLWRGPNRHTRANGASPFAVEDAAAPSMLVRQLTTSGTNLRDTDSYCTQEEGGGERDYEGWGRLRCTCTYAGTHTRTHTHLHQKLTCKQ